MPDSPHSPAVDVVGVGVNATDTIIRLPHFPSLDSKVEILSAEIRAGGQVASAIVACQRWGLRARYVGKIGDDSAGEFQRREMAREGVRTHWIISPGRASQTAFILVDEASGERTVLWKRDPHIALQPKDLKKHFISNTKALLVDGHDTSAAVLAARWARRQSIAVVGDFDNLYPGVTSLLRSTDYIITSKEFPQRITGESNLLKALPKIRSEFKCLISAATLGRLGVLAWNGTRFFLSPGFKVKAVDTTGSGDVFHGAFLLGLVRGWPIQQILEFGCAAAALNCEALGARGNLAPLKEIERLQRLGHRSERAFAHKELLEAGATAQTGFGEIARRPPRQTQTRSKRRRRSST